MATHARALAAGLFAEIHPGGDDDGGVQDRSAAIVVLAVKVGEGGLDGGVLRMHRDPLPVLRRDGLTLQRGDCIQRRGV